MDIIRKVTKDAERLLKSLKAKYYIELPTGEQIWEGLDGYELVESQEEEKPQRRRRQVAGGRTYGELTAYFKPFLEKCAHVGDVAEVPAGKYSLADLHGGVSAYCAVHWGKSTYKTYSNKVKGQVEVMRTSESLTPRKDKAQSKINGEQARPKFRPLGHGLDALASLQFDDQDRNGSEDRR